MWRRGIASALIASFTLTYLPAPALGAPAGKQEGDPVVTIEPVGISLEQAESPSPAEEDIRHQAAVQLAMAGNGARLADQAAADFTQVSQGKPEADPVVTIEPVESLEGLVGATEEVADQEEAQSDVERVLSEGRKAREKVEALRQELQQEAREAADKLNRTDGGAPAKKEVVFVNSPFLSPSDDLSPGDILDQRQRSNQGRLSPSAGLPPDVSNTVGTATASLSMTVTDSSPGAGLSGPVPQGDGAPAKKADRDEPAIPTKGPAPSFKVDLSDAQGESALATLGGVIRSIFEGLIEFLKMLFARLDRAFDNPFLPRPDSDDSPESPGDPGPEDDPEPPSPDHPRDPEGPRGAPSGDPTAHPSDDPADDPSHEKGGSDNPVLDAGNPRPDFRNGLDDLFEEADRKLKELGLERDGAKHNLADGIEEKIDSIFSWNPLEAFNDAATWEGLEADRDRIGRLNEQIRQQQAATEQARKFRQMAQDAEAMGDAEEAQDFRQAAMNTLLGAEALGLRNRQRARDHSLRDYGRVNEALVDAQYRLDRTQSTVQRVGAGAGAAAVTVYTGGLGAPLLVVLGSGTAAGTGMGYFGDFIEGRLNGQGGFKTATSRVGDRLSDATLDSAGAYFGGKLATGLSGPMREGVFFVGFGLPHTGAEVAEGLARGKISADQAAHRIAKNTATDLATGLGIGLVVPVFGRLLPKGTGNQAGRMRGSWLKRRTPPLDPRIETRLEKLMAHSSRPGKPLVSEADIRNAEYLLREAPLELERQLARRSQVPGEQIFFKPRIKLWGRDQGSFNPFVGENGTLYLNPLTAPEELPGLMAHEVEHIHQAQVIAAADAAGVELPSMFYRQTPTGRVSKIARGIRKAVRKAPSDPSRPFGPRYFESEVRRDFGQALSRDFADSIDAFRRGNFPRYWESLTERAARVSEYQRALESQPAGSPAWMRNRLRSDYLLERNGIGRFFEKGGLDRTR